MARILVIDDDAMLLNCVADALSFNLRDSQVVSVRNGKMGLQLAQELQPDVIVCDLNMPEMNGYEVLARIRRDEMTANIPFIFLTSEANSNKRKLGIELGADEYLTKPFALSQLVNAVESQLTT
jgi:DNA-binding response OmpR family regulator